MSSSSNFIAIKTKSHLFQNKLISCLIKVKDIDRAVNTLKELGVLIESISENIFLIRTNISTIDKLQNNKNIEYMELSSPLSIKMDTARTATKVNAIQSGEAFGTPYDGSNVIIGVVDDTIDYNHPDFLGEDDLTRVQYISETDNDGNIIECTKQDIAYSNCNIADGGQGYIHGTHVTGIAAGCDSTYTGIAPNADIIFIFTNLSNAYTNSEASESFSGTVLQGVSKIFEKADAMDKPAVVNLSMGTSLGAHDGTSLLEQGLTELVNGKPGRIIVGAAGNEQVVPSRFSPDIRDYVGGIHASINVTDGDSDGSRLAVWRGSGAVNTFTGGTIVDLWLDKKESANCKLAVFAYNEGRENNDFLFSGLSSTADADLSSGDITFAFDSNQNVSSIDGDVEVSIYMDDSDAENEKPHASILIKPTSNASSASLEKYWYDIVLRASGGNCTGHMWLYYDYPTYHDFLKGIEDGGFDVSSDGGVEGYQLIDGDSNYTMTIPATAKGVIAAGSWLAQKPAGSGLSQWVGLDGKTYDQSNLNDPGGTGSSIGDLSSFSSLGPTADGRHKPDILAPGEPIISTKARNASVSTSIEADKYHYKNAGTSMAAPYVSGVIALLLQKNNTLTTDDIKTILSTDASTKSLSSKTDDPLDSYGGGKLNAQAILAAVDSDTSKYKGIDDLDPIMSGMCSLHPDLNDANWNGALIFLFSFFVLFVAYFWMKFFLFSPNRRNWMKTHP